MSNEFEANCQDAEKLLQRFRNDTLPHFINGQHDAGRSGKTFESVTPVDNSVIGKVAAGNGDDIDVACMAAEAAFEEWKDMPGKERKKSTPLAMAPSLGFSSTVRAGGRPSQREPP